MSASLVQAVLAAFGASGILGALVALFKLKPEANSMAVTQLQGVAMEWARLYQQVAEEMKQEQARADRFERESRRLRVLLEAHGIDPDPTVEKAT